MPFTRNDVEDEAKRLTADRSIADIVPGALDRLAERLTKDPSVYLMFGPYWWGLKWMLGQRGHGLGDYFDWAIYEAAGFGTAKDAPVPTFLDYVAGMMHQYETSFAPSDTTDFEADGGGWQVYRLRDPDMEARYVGAPLSGRPTA